MNRPGVDVDILGRTLHRFNHRHGDIDLDELRRRVSARLGVEVGVIARTVTDSSGTAQPGPGVIRFERMGSEEPVEVDPHILRAVIDGLVAERDQVRARRVLRRTVDPPPAQDDGEEGHPEPQDRLPRWLTSAQLALTQAATAATDSQRVDAVVGWLTREVALVRAELGLPPLP